MLLEKLKEYSERIDPTPIMYQETPIRWLINLDSQGRFLDFIETASEGEGKRKSRGKIFLAPTIGKTSGIKAKLLVENEGYVLGFNKEGKTEGRALDCHAAFKELIARCAETTRSPAVLAVKKFLDAHSPGNIELPPDFKPGDLFTFRVDGQYPIEENSVRSFWAGETAGKETDDQGMVADCLVCGQEKTVVDRLPIKIKRIPGGQTSGTSLVSANAPAFESYGLEASYISPICHHCGESFGKALNDLIANEATHITIGPVVYTFWTREKVDFDIATFFSDPQPEDVKKLMAKPLTGERASLQDKSIFYCAAFSASGGRVVVRDWVVTTLGEVQKNLARYFRAQALVDWDGSEGKPLPLWQLTRSLVFKREQVPPNVPSTILRFAFKGSELPMSLVFQAVKRNRAERGLNRNKERPWEARPRAALIKMVLMSKQEYLNKEDAMEKIDLSNDSPAYLCGRLFGLLEDVQRTAMPGVSSTITDRFYGTASTAPASVFGRLMKGSQNHLSKLKKDKPGAFFALEEDLQEVSTRLKTFPLLLNLEEQGLFALGYYHQKAQRRAEMAERKAKKDEGKA